MKRIFLVVALCALAGFSFAQKKAVKDAKSALSKNSAEARELIKPALTNPETANDPDTWKTAGDIEYTVVEKGVDAERLKAFDNNKGWDVAAVANALYNMYHPYLTADSLAQLPDAKGKVKNKVRKDIVKNFKSVHPHYITAGIHFNENNDLVKASELFEIYWTLPSWNIFGKDLTGFAAQDSTYQTIKYYAVITAMQAKDHPRAIRLLNKLIAEPYVANATYIESDPYELLASEYYLIGDTVQYVDFLKNGAQKFPKKQYFVTNLINEYIKAGDFPKAMDYLDQAITNDPDNTCDLKSVKASLFIDKNDYTTAQKFYNEALDTDAKCERALEGLGVLHVLEAQTIKDSVAKLPRKEQLEADKKTKDLYLKALPYLEKLYNIQKERAASGSDVKKTLLKLQNVYYNLSYLNVDKQKELDSVNAELEEINKAI